MAQSNAFIAAGTKLGVTATAPATFDAAGYGALTFTDIGELTSIGDVGRTYAVTEHKVISSRETFKYKGTYNDGDMSLGLAKAIADAGQIILKAALNSDLDYYFALEFNDNEAGTSNSFLYIPGKVTSFPDSVGDPDSIVTKTVNVSVSGSIIEVDAV